MEEKKIIELKKKLEDLLDKQRFIKCHQSFIVNKAYITKYKNDKRQQINTNTTKIRQQKRQTIGITTS